MRARIGAVAEWLAALAVLGAVAGLAWSVWLPVRVAGGSMSPALLPGDVAIVGRGLRPYEGSIVLATRPGHGAVLHRVVSLGPDGAVTTRGDANPVRDAEDTRASDVTGVVVRVIPVGRVLQRWRGAR